MKTARLVFNYVKPLWENRQGQVSVRAVLAIALTIDFIRNIGHAIFVWDTQHSFEGLAMVLGIEAGLITAMLGLTAIQNVQDKKTEIDLKKTAIVNKVVKTTDDDDPDIQVKAMR